MDHRSIALGVAVVWLVALSGQSALQGADKHESSKAIRYLRVTGSEFVRETEIHLLRTEEGIIVTSVTHRGERTLTVTSRFDPENALTSATVTLLRGKNEQSASVSVTDSTARVLRNGNETNELACPGGVIVTSAPDWTDSFMAVRRYDANGSTTQEFPGLWIHPTREPLELTLRLTRLGQDSVTLCDKRMNLDRFLLVLRGGSRYVVWGNQQGQLVRLVPAAEGSGGIVLNGWQRATRDLKPPVSRDRSN
jgi:hypothetical protein